MAANPRLEDLRRRLQKEPGSRLFAQLAEELRKDGEIAEAIRVSREGLARHPNYPSARMTLGRALYDTGDLEGARSEIEAVCQGAPDNILAYRLLAECLEGLGRWDEAAERHRHVLLLAPGDRASLERLAALEEKSREAAARPSPGPEAPDDAAAFAPIPLVDVADEEFEIERSVDRPPPAVLDRDAVTAREADTGAPATFEWEEATLPPVAPVEGLLDEPVEPGPVARHEPEVETAETTPGRLEPTPLLQPEPGKGFPESDEPPAEASFLEPEPAAESQPPLTSPTLAELYFNQGLPDKAAQVYRELLQKEPGHDKARARLREIEALLAGAAAPSQAGPPEAALAGAGAEPVVAGDPRSERRKALERALARLEGFLVAVRRGAP